VIWPVFTGMSLVICALDVDIASTILAKWWKCGRRRKWEIWNGNTSYIIHHTSYIIHHTSYIIHHTSYIIHHCNEFLFFFLYTNSDNTERCVYVLDAYIHTAHMHVHTHIQTHRERHTERDRVHTLTHTHAHTHTHGTPPHTHILTSLKFRCVFSVIGC